MSSTGIQVTTREVAAAHGVSLRTAQRWAKAGKLNAVKDTAGRWIITLPADLVGFKAFQIEKACEAIEQNAILPTKRAGIFTAVSSDGSTTYLVAKQGCTCPAGQKQRACWHRCAVTILTASAPVALRRAA